MSEPSWVETIAALREERDRLKVEAMENLLCASAWQSDCLKARDRAAKAEDLLAQSREATKQHYSNCVEADAQLEKLEDALRESRIDIAAMRRERYSLAAEVQTWKDNHALVKSDRDAWKARAEKAEKRILSLIEENLARELVERARAEKAEAEVKATLNCEAAIRRDNEKMLARVKKAEAERDEARDLLGKACGLAMVSLHEGENWVGVPDQEPCVSIVRIQKELRAERTRAEKYLAAIVEAERLAMKGVCDINDGTWISDIALLLRPVVEEARRGTE